jgi:hypothetical protein
MMIRFSISSRARKMCSLGGTNDLSDDWRSILQQLFACVAECSRVLGINKPDVLSERLESGPFRRSGVRIERARLSDGRSLIHNYGHGGSGFTISWGCAELVARIAEGQDQTKRSARAMSWDESPDHSPVKSVQSLERKLITSSDLYA